MAVPNLRFKEFSPDSNFKTLSLESSGVQVIDGDRGTNYPNGSDFSDNGFCLFLNAKNVTKNGFAFDEKMFISEAKDNSMSKGKLVKGDLVLTTRGSIGNLAHFNENVPYEHLRINSGMVLLRTRHSELSPVYLYQQLNSPPRTKNISFLAFGSAQPQLTVSGIKSLKLNIPSIDEQTKTANFLTAVDEKISRLTKKHELLTSYKKGVMQKIFNQELRFKNDEGREFPEWEIMRLEEIAVCLDNFRKPVNEAERAGMIGDIPYWGANNIMGYVNDFLFDKTIVLLAEDGGNFNEYSTRPIANLSTGKCWVNNHAHVLTGNSLCLTEYLYYSLVHKDITAYVSGGTRSKLTKGEMFKIPVATPSIEEQRLIVKFFSSLDRLINISKSQLEAAKEYKQGLLQQMFV